MSGHDTISARAHQGHTCACFYIKPELNGFGMIEVQTSMGNAVHYDNPERTIYDVLRSRNRCDEKTWISSIQNYANSLSRDFPLLAEYAEQLRIYNSHSCYRKVL